MDRATQEAVRIGRAGAIRAGAGRSPNGEPDDATKQVALVWLEGHKESVGKLINMLLRRYPSEMRAQLREVAHDEAVRTAPMAMLTYDPSYGASMTTHVFNDMRWYIYKALKKEQRRLSSRPTAPPDDVDRMSRHANDGTAKLAVVEEVQCLLEKLSPAHQQLISWYYLEEMTLAEVADALCCSVSSATRVIDKALRELRRAAAEMR